MIKTKSITWIIPCYNEENVIFELLKRIKKVSQKLNKYNWELILIDDGSSDNTKNLLKQIDNYPFRLVLLSFSRNFGHQSAVQAGMDYCKSDAAIIIDADLQDPPEIAEMMIKKWENGYQVIFGQRTLRLKEKWFKKLTAYIFYRLFNFLSGISIPLDTGDFRLIDKTVIDAIKKLPEKGRFIRGLVSWVGFKQTSVKYQRDERFAGDTKYTLKKMFALAIEGLTTFSRRPLRLATFTGFFFSILAFLYMLYIFYLRLFTEILVAGWAAIIIVLLFSSGFQMIFIGLLGEYIGNIFFETKNRPIYILEEMLVIQKNV